jgi:hypothetical protein
MDVLDKAWTADLEGKTQETQPAETKLQELKAEISSDFAARFDDLATPEKMS